MGGPHVTVTTRHRVRSSRGEAVRERTVTRMDIGRKKRERGRTAAAIRDVAADHNDRQQSDHRVGVSHVRFSRITSRQRINKNKIVYLHTEYTYTVTKQRNVSK